MKMKFVNPPNTGWIETRLEQKYIDFLWKIIQARNSSLKENLAGNISHSFAIIDENNYFFDEVLSDHIRSYYQSDNCRHPINEYSADVFKLHLKDFWVNFQHQGEFNPYHQHGGVYSFAIWLKIPTDWKEQHKLPFLEGIKDCDKKASNFEFEYLDMLGNIRNYPYLLDKSMEGTMVFFPARLRHSVYPFYNSNQPRISVAGNIWGRREN